MEFRSTTVLTERDGEDLDRSAQRIAFDVRPKQVGIRRHGLHGQDISAEKAGDNRVPAEVRSAVDHERAVVRSKTFDQSSEHRGLEGFPTLLHRDRRGDERISLVVHGERELVWYLRMTGSNDSHVSSLPGQMARDDGTLPESTRALRS